MKRLRIMFHDLLTFQPLHRLLGSEDRTAQGMIGPERRHENLVNEIVGCVLDHLDLFEDDAALHLDVFIGEAGRGDDVGQKIEGCVNLLIEHVRVERCVLFAGERINVPAEDVDDLRDLGGGAATRALEHQMLEKVRRAAVFLRFNGRSTAQVIAERDRADVGQRLDENRQTRRKQLPRDGRGWGHLGRL